MKGFMCFEKPAYVLSWAGCGGVKEAGGPLASGFDKLWNDNRLGKKTWEEAERELKLSACRIALQKAGRSAADVHLGGDLLNQCISSGYAARELGFPFLGLYGACSTMAESLLLGAALTSSGLAATTLCSASSHFCTAERQYRYPLAYGGQRSPTAQWTATAAGAVLLSGEKPPYGGIRIKRALVGRVFDPGVKDGANMGAAMAQSAYESLHTWFAVSGSRPEDYSLIVTGDLADVGKKIVVHMLSEEGTDITPVYDDCGLMLYHGLQDTHSGGSGCGCSAAVLCAYILPEMKRGLLKRVLFCGTGALLSPVSLWQGESIPGICHIVELEAEK